MTLHPLRNYLIIISLLALVGGIFCGVRRCSGGEGDAYRLSAEDSLEQQQFEAEIEADSLRREDERRARWEANRRQWDEERRQRWAEEHRRRGMSPQQRAYLEDQRRWDSIRANRIEKLPEGTHLDLNRVDSLTLLRVPLIGPARAAQILSYRRRLGGYASVSQLLEIENVPKEMLRWFTLTEGRGETVAISINQADFKTLVRHPYLSFDQVKEIMNYRRKFGQIKSWQDLSLSPYFTSADFARLTPYISFN